MLPEERRPVATANMGDVAELAGVSIKTVSRVVNQEPNVRDSTRERVEQAIAKLNYRPNLSARSLASQRSHLIGLIYDDPSGYEIPSAGYVLRMQLGAQRACRQAGCELLIHPCSYRNRDITREIRSLIEDARPAGIVLAAPLSNMPKIVRTIDATGTPCVSLSPGTRRGRRPAVVTNDREASAEMTTYLASLGHTRISFVKGHCGHKAVGNRYRGYLDGLAKAGVPFIGELVQEGDNSFESGELAAGRLLRMDAPPTAVFAANDDMAAGVIRAARLLGVDVPGRLSVAGWDDIALARLLCPTLTTIRQPLDSMAGRAAAMLIEEVRTASRSRGAEVIPATLQIRESTGAPPG